MSEKHIVEWKWSNGEQYEKSLKKSNDEQVIDDCLNDEIMHNFDAPNGFIHKENKLQGQNEKLSNRHMIMQKGINPYVNTENYIEHLNNETSFLRPKDSNLADK